MDKTDRINAFKSRSDSLRLPASRVAALTGYHPYAVLPEVFLDLIYQGRVGHELRQQDARDLHIQLVSTDVLLMDLARKAGADTAKALESAIQVKDGTKKLDNIKVAQIIKKKVLEEAKKSKKLSPEEIKRLAEGTRSYVDTGFGTHHEDDALNLFEKQCGWEVRERNASILNWPFARAEDVAGDYYSAAQEVNDELTVKAMAPACARELIAHSDHGIQQHQEKAEEKKAKVVETTKTSNYEEKPKPFFNICGAVDGVRDELWCRPDESTDEEWELRKVIVECKHRMRRAYNTPPLYDQIQTTAYCLMYGAEDADIIQVMRKEKQRPRKRQKVDTESLQPGQTKLEGFLVTTVTTEKPDGQKVGNSSSSENIENEPDTEQRTTNDDKAGAQSIEIVVSRMSLDDGVMNHRHNWQSIILPRLRSFVDAVYRVRANDDARKLFLQVVANEEQSGYATLVSWDLLHHECPWLKECNTALQWKLRS